MGVSGKFHTPEKERGTHWMGGCVGLGASLDIFGEEILPILGFEP